MFEGEGGRAGDFGAGWLEAGIESVLGLKIVVTGALERLDEPFSGGEVLMEGRTREDEAAAEGAAGAERLRGQSKGGVGPVLVVIYLCAIGSCATSKASSNWPRLT